MRQYNLSINNSDYEVIIKDVTSEEVTAEVNGETHVVRINDIVDLNKPAATIQVDQKTEAPVPSVTTSIPQGVQTTGGLSSNLVVNAPIPGQIISINVSKGDKVLKGQKVLVLEAMKLENVITADSDGVVDKILVKEGDTVNQGQDLLIIK